MFAGLHRQSLNKPKSTECSSTDDAGVRDGFKRGGNTRFPLNAASSIVNALRMAAVTAGRLTEGAAALDAPTYFASLIETAKMNDHYVMHDPACR